MKILLILALFCSAAFAQDDTVPEQKTAATPFLMEITDIFNISGIGTVVSGRIEQGTIRTGERVEIIGARPVNITTISMLMLGGKSAQEASKGSDVNLVLKGVSRDQLSRGQIVVKPGSVRAVTRFEATIDMFASHERGRNTPISTGYRPQIVFRTVPFSGRVTLPPDVESAMPGTKGLRVTIELSESAGIETDTKFSIRDSGREVGTGVVTAIVD